MHPHQPTGASLAEPGLLLHDTHRFSLRPAGVGGTSGRNGTKLRDPSSAALEVQSQTRVLTYDWTKNGEQVRRSKARPGQCRKLCTISASSGRTEIIPDIDIAPDYFVAHEELAKLYPKTGDLPRAQYHFRRSLEIQPDDLWSLLFPANSLAVQGKTAEAEQTYRLATTLRPSHKEAAEFFARFLESVGKKREAATVRAALES